MIESWHGYRFPIGQACDAIALRKVPSPAASPVPMAAFELLREVDALFTDLELIDPDIQQVRFRFVTSIGPPTLEMDVQRPSNGLTTWHARYDLEDRVQAQIRGALARANNVIAPLQGDDRPNTLLLAFNPTATQPLGATWYGCYRTDIPSRVETILGPEGSRVLRALEQARNMEARTSRTVKVEQPRPRF